MPPEPTPAGVADHYTLDGLADRVEAALAAAGLTAPIPPDDLAGLDELHTRGRESTRELARLAEVQAGDVVLDLGSGVGGPARYLAHHHGARVTGLDLTPAYADVARLLADKTGLADRTEFLTGDAMACPFEDARFDLVWTQHVTMNIADKRGLYREVARLLKPGGRFAFYDLTRGSNPAPLDMPVPWASDGAHSHLVPFEAMAGWLADSGLELLETRDTTGRALRWGAARLADLEAAQAAGKPPPPVSPATLFGPAWATRVRNIKTAFDRGQIRPIHGLAVKPE